MSIRLRLTLWYVLLLAVILIAFSGALYALLSFNLFSEVDRTLQTRAEEIQRGINTAVDLQSDPRVFFARRRLTLPPAETFATQDVFVQVQIDTADGAVMSRSDNLGEKALVVATALLTRVKEGAAVYANLSIDQVPLRVYVAPLNTRGQTIGVIQVAQSLQEVNATLRQLGTLLVAGILGGLAVAFISGAILARGALAPMDRITQTAGAISRGGELSQRIDAPQVMDEVGRLAATFNEMLARIEGSFRAQKRFVADVSHELRSPLTAIRGNLDLLRRGADNPQALADIDSEAARMQRLVNDLLLLAQADAGLQIRQEVVELDTLLLEVYRQARLTAKGVNVALGNEDQAQITGDADRIKQMLLNLADNALKYTPNGGTVTLALERDTEWARVSVSDTGQGILAPDLEKIFDRFYRVDADRSREKGGAGLGLAICKSIADAHGGRIEVASEVGRGSKFVVWLPMKK